MGQEIVSTVNQITKGVQDFKLEGFINAKTADLYSLGEDLLSGLNIGGLSLDAILALKDMDLMSIIRSVLDYFGLGWIMDLYDALKDLFSAIFKFISDAITLLLGSDLLRRLAGLSSVLSNCIIGADGWNQSTSLSMQRMVLSGLVGLLACLGLGDPMTDLLDKIDPRVKTVVSDGYMDTTNPAVPFWVPEVVEEKRTGKHDSILRDMAPMMIASLQVGPAKNNTKIDNQADRIKDIASHSFTKDLHLADSNVNKSIITSLPVATGKQVTKKAESYNDVISSMTHLGGGVSPVLTGSSAGMKDLAKAKSLSKPASDAPVAVITDDVLFQIYG